ncbi:MAG: hypothetical protein IKP47_00215 [Ruminococcus sp.]|nr:hypothetical protein [Ruminococcus sp.]
MNEKEIKMLYEEDLQRTAPDMDKLWSRIESAVDAAENKTDTPAAGNIQAATRKKNNIIRFAAMAAACALIISAGIFILGRDKPKTSETSYSETQNGGNAFASDIADGKNDAKTAEKPAEAAEFSSRQEEIRADEALDNETEKTEKSEKAADAVEDAAPQEEMSGSQAAVDYKSLTGRTKEQLVRNYKPEYSGSFNEDAVLAQTDILLECLIVKAEPKDSFCTYTAEVINGYARSGEGLQAGSQITFDSASPVLLSEGGQYLLPLAKNGDGYKLVFESAPQIEYVPGGNIVFHDGWTTLCEGSETCIYPTNSYNSEYSGRMRLAPAENIQKLTDKWAGR